MSVPKARPGVWESQLLPHFSAQRGVFKSHYKPNEAQLMKDRRLVRSRDPSPSQNTWKQPWIQGDRQFISKFFPLPIDELIALSNSGLLQSFLENSQQARFAHPWLRPFL